MVVLPRRRGQDVAAGEVVILAIDDMGVLRKQMNTHWLATNEPLSTVVEVFLFESFYSNRYLRQNLAGHRLTGVKILTWS